MLKYWNSIVFIFFLTSMLSQEEFSFQLNFEDAEGNKDSVIVGYDENATDGIDVLFGEQNIISQPWDSVLDVRLSEQLSYQNGLAPTPPPSTHTKKQIINKTCNNIFGFEITLNIAAKYYPIEVKWDSSLFISALDSCHAGSLFTTYDYYQNDVGSGFAFFANQDSLILYEDPGFPFYDDDTLKINLHWISFSKEQELSVEEVDENRNNLFSLYPNPTGGNFFIHIEGSDLIDPVIMVTDLSGKIVKEMSLSSDMTKCELGTIQDGMYLVHILSDGKVIETQKLIYAK